MAAEQVYSDDNIYRLAYWGYNRDLGFPGRVDRSEFEKTQAEFYLVDPEIVNKHTVYGPIGKLVRWPNLYVVSTDQVFKTSLHDIEQRLQDYQLYYKAQVEKADFNENAVIDLESTEQMDQYGLCAFNSRFNLAKTEQYRTHKNAKMIFDRQYNNEILLNQVGKQRQAMLNLHALNVVHTDSQDNSFQSQSAYFLKSHLRTLLEMNKQQEFMPKSEVLRTLGEDGLATVYKTQEDAARAARTESSGAAVEMISGTDTGSFRGREPR